MEDQIPSLNHRATIKESIMYYITSQAKQFSIHILKFNRLVVVTLLQSYLYNIRQLVKNLVLQACIEGLNVKPDIVFVDHKCSILGPSVGVAIIL